MDESTSNIPKQIQVLEEVKYHVKGNPNCKVEHCHGRGYTGVRQVKERDGRSELILELCRCAQMGRTDYELLVVRIERLIRGQALLANDLADMDSFVRRRFEDFEQTLLKRTLLGNIVRLWRKLRAKT